jgi:hypothetical protein
MGETEFLVEQIRSRFGLIRGLQDAGNSQAERWQSTLSELVKVQRGDDIFGVLRERELHHDLQEIMRNRVSTTNEIERIVNEVKGLLSELRRTGRTADPQGIADLERSLEGPLAEARDLREKARNYLANPFGRVV